MENAILITGSEGLVGSALDRALFEQNQPVARLDLRASAGVGRGDVRDPDTVARAIRGCRGVIHLAAVSRVVWGERDPGLCRSTNVGGTRNILEAALAAPHRPWVILASSREVYGQADRLPVVEDTPLRPVNVYGRSKVSGERLVHEVRVAGLRAAVVRLSNVYGSTRDHADRVVPAFASAAVRGEQLRVDGFSHTFDFTHIDDTARGLLPLVDLLDREEPPPPIHLLTGQPTTLGEVASLAVTLARSRSGIVEAPPRTFDVSHFFGDPSRARELLGWEPRVTLRVGLARLVEDLRVLVAPVEEARAS